MFSSLRCRLLAAFGLLILLTVLLTGLLAAITTANRFELFVTEHGQAQARQIAPLLEASYLLHGDWQQVDKLWRATPASATSDNGWQNDVDWVAMVAAELGMDRDLLWAEMGAVGTLAAVITQQGKSVDDLVTTIYAAEKATVDKALAAGTLTSQSAADYMANMAEDIRAYLISSGFGTTVDWNAITADHFGLTKAELLDALTNRTITELAQARRVDLQPLRQAIINAEVADLRANRRFSEEDAVSLLANAIEWLDDYLGATPVESASAAIPDAPSGLLANYLHGGEHLLLVSLEGRLLYDSTGKYQGEQLPTPMLADATPLHKAPGDQPIALVLIASGPGNYSSQQQNFLRGVTYSLLLSGGLAAFVGLLAAMLVARQVTAPVTALTAAAQQIADGQSGARLPVTAPDELGQMSAAFNQMATALETQRDLRQRLVNDLAHELGTPLSVIQLEMQALRDGLQSPGQAFEQVQGEIELLRNLISDLGNLESTDNGQLLLQPEPIDLLALAQRAVKRWQAKAERKGVTLAITAPAELLPLIEADAARLTQVLGNLLDNALRYTATGGAITVCCRSATLRSLALTSPYTPVTALDAPALVVTVHDTGSGIPAADLPHLFERFYRVDSSRNRRSGGRGLGLAIVRQIITAHGGHVWAQSAVGQGSTFGFSLPITELE